MADAASLVIKVKSKGITKTTKDLNKLEKQGGKTEKAAKSLGKAFVKMGAVAGVAAAAIGVGLFVKTIKNTIEQERVVAQLNQTLKSTGRFSKESSKGLQAYAAHLQTVSTFGDEAIIASQSLMLTFTQIGKKIMPRAQQAVLDVATAMGTDLKSASIQVGKALNDPIEGMSALSRSGITFSKEQKELVKNMVAVGDSAGAQILILKELEVQFGGSAKAARDTLGGALISLGSSFGDLFEVENGSTKKLADAINELNKELNDNQLKTGMNKFTEGIFDLSSKVILAGAAITDFFGGDSLSQLEEKIKTLQETIKISESDDMSGKSQMLINVAKTQLVLDKSRLKVLQEERVMLQYRKGILTTVELGGNLDDEDPNETSNLTPLISINTSDNIKIKSLDLITERYKELIPLSASYNETLKTPQEIYNEEIALLLELNKTRNRVTGEGLLSDENYIRGRIEAQGRLTDSIVEGNLTIDDSLAKTKDHFSQFEGAVGSWGASFAQEMIDGSGSFKNFANSMIKDMAKIALQQATQPIFNSIFQGITGSFGGFTAGTGGGAGGMVPALEGGGFTGNSARSGGVDGKGGFPAILHPQETVIDHAKGGSMGNVSVVVNVDASGTNTQGGGEGKDIGKAIGVAVRNVLIQEKRSGGLLA